MKYAFSRREFVRTSGIAATAGLAASLWPLRAFGAAASSSESPRGRRIAPGIFQPNWESLTRNYRCPEWFRDAKFGIWAHWTAQCVPEQGDWYARNMYLQGHPQYEYHVKTYGHPSKVGFKDIDHLWKAERWEPEKLMDLYQQAGAKIFFALANHHDNFDAYDSKHHAWNSVKIGPKKDIVGAWAKAARARGLRFGVSNHSAHAWRWMQTAYGYDGEGPLAGVRYDAATLTAADGRGTWWEGLDPQVLYTGPTIKMPAGITSAHAVSEWHKANTFPNDHFSPPAPFADNWFDRCQDLVDQYDPDVLYFDNADLPLGQTGLDLVTHFYNANIERRGGRLEAVVNGKKMMAGHETAVIEDIERGVAAGIRPVPWQTDTCIGQWHYSRAYAEENKYKTVDQVVDMLIDIVSKNGNLMLSVPLRGDGTHDDKELSFLAGLSAWMKVNGEGIFGSRPWSTFGEGPSVEEKPESGLYGGSRDVRTEPYTSADVRFTTKGGELLAYFLALPSEPRVLIKSLRSGSPHVAGREVSAVSLLGYPGRLNWTRGEAGLHVHLPDTLPSEHAIALRISGVVG